MTRPPVTSLVRDLPATIPFVGPEALERQLGHALPLRLGANESAFGISPLARQAMQATLERVAWYGDPEAYDLRVDLARRHGVTPEEIRVGSGIDDLLGVAVRAFLDRGEVAVTSLGAYPTFNYHVAGYGGVLHRVPYQEGRTTCWHWPARRPEWGRASSIWPIQTTRRGASIGLATCCTLSIASPLAVWCSWTRPTPTLCRRTTCRPLMSPLPA